MAQLVGHASLRRRVMDDTGRQATADEIESMKSILKNSSTRVLSDYPRACSTPTVRMRQPRRLLRLQRSRPEDGIYESHIRAESSRGVGVSAAVDEVIRIAQEADIPAHIAHIKVLGKDVWERRATLCPRSTRRAIRPRHYGGSVPMGGVLHPT